MSDNKRKCMVICLLALFIGLIGVVLPEQEDIAFEYVVNNTDLYNKGRVTGTNYTANNSAIQLFLIFHVIGTGAPVTVDTNLSINGTVVEDRDYRTSVGAGVHEHFSMTAHIPKGANYSVTNSSNLETVEWREYPILSGRNGTLSINQTIVQGGGTGSQNLSQVLFQGNDAALQNIENVTGIHPLNFSVNDANMSFRINQTTGALFSNRISTFKNLSGGGAAPNADNQDNFDYLFSNSRNDGADLVAFQTISNISSAFVFFQARRARGLFHPNNNTAMLYPLQNGDIIFRIVGTGWNNISWGGTRSYIDLIAAGNWNETSMPTMIEFGTNDISGSVLPQFRVYPNGSIQIVRMAGSSKTYLCQENGFVMAGTPGC